MLFSFFRLLYFFILSTPFFYFLFQYNQIIEIYSPFSWNFARTISTFFPLERYSKPQIIIHLFSYLILFLRLFFFFLFFRWSLSGRSDLKEVRRTTPRLPTVVNVRKLVFLARSVTSSLGKIVGHRGSKDYN